MDVCGESLKKHVRRIAEAPRPAESDELRRVRDYVQRELESSGWLVQPHRFSVPDGSGRLLTGINLLARRSGVGQPGRPLFYVGAHLDTRPDSPGADDNASAVAALLELARLIPSIPISESQLDVELIAFDLEEEGMLGGAEHARLAQARGIDLRGMVSLEMLGYRDRTPGSQQLPRKLVGLYPDTGDFIAVIGNQQSQRLIDVFAAGMRETPDLPVETLAVDGNGESLQATRLSDHSPFWDEGFPALMITDTSFLRNPFYHTAGDTIETLDMNFLQLVAQGCWSAVRRIMLNRGREPL